MKALLVWLFDWLRTLVNPEAIPVPELPAIPGLPAQYADLPSVAMVPPPAYLLADTSRFVTEAVAALPNGEKGRLTWIATTKGVNLALVDKVNDHVNVTAWIGKSWGQPIAAGVAGEVHW